MICPLLHERHWRSAILTLPLQSRECGIGLPGSQSLDQVMRKELTRHRKIENEPKENIVSAIVVTTNTYQYAVLYQSAYIKRIGIVIVTFR